VKSGQESKRKKVSKRGEKRPSKAERTNATEPVEVQHFGRPTEYRVEYNEQARRFCLLRGATDAELGEFFDVSETTINNWKRQHPDFLASINEGKEKADANVAASLYERACGYSHPDVHVSNFQGMITVTPLVKHYPPDTAAAFIWLKNRSGWKDKQELEATITDKTEVVLPNVDTGE